MERICILISVVALCVALLFVPHHEKGPSSFGNTMFELLSNSLGIVAEGPAVVSSLVLLGVIGLLLVAHASR